MTNELAVWTDFGGVLTPPVDVTFREFSDRVGVPLHALKEAMRRVGEAHGTDSMGVLDIPLLDEQEWTAEVENELDRTFGVAATLRNFGDRWFEGRPPNQAWIERLDELRDAGIFVGLLSNLPPSWEWQRRHMVDDSHFDDVVCSHAVGCRKPEPEIFRIAARRAGRAAGDCVLVDDVDKNCAGAVAAGWAAVHFADAGQAGREIEDLLCARVAAG
jgi:putative hydrolase of the HAD superfamily